MIGRPGERARAIRDHLRRRGLRGALATMLGWVDKLPVMQFGVRRMMLPLRVRHVHGPRQVACGDLDVIAVTVVRNGAPWVRTFLSHHRARGIRHFVVLDNGSTDDTVALLSREPDVTVLRTDAPYKAYENTMKRYLADRFCKGRWCLCVDIDELFDFPLSGEVSLARFLSYLDAHDFDAVMTQMLDRFADTPLAELSNGMDDDLRAICAYCDISAIIEEPYLYPVPDDRLKMLRGGIRRSIFGTMNGLTKVSLFRMNGRVKPFVQWHHAEGARIADVSAVLLHFPFVSSFYRKVSDAVSSGRYGYLTSDEYASYLRGLEHNPGLSLKLPTSRKFEDVDQLLEDGFLVASSRYRIWQDRGARPASNPVVQRCGGRTMPSTSTGAVTFSA